MNRVAIAFSTKDRTELSRQSIAPLYDGQHALFWVDGSNSEEGQNLHHEYPALTGVYGNVRGGADAAIVFSLTAMLRHPAGYTHVGLVENDVVLDRGWFDDTFALFARGRDDGLEVGAVSARCYTDRVLIQRDGYAICHNLGAGQIIFTRRAAELVLKHFRTTWTLENRRVFMHASGIDIGADWAFKGAQQWLCADWGFDKTLTEHGLSSLALTPARCEMIGQVPSLAEQGLTLARGPVEAKRNDEVFELYKRRMQVRREFEGFPASPFYQDDTGRWTIFPHQVEQIGGKYFGDWRLKWSQGHGPFAYRAGEELQGTILTSPDLRPSLNVPISGPCAFLVSGGENGGRVQVVDEASGYDVSPELAPEGPTTQVMYLNVPAGISYRNIRLTALTPGVVFYGIITQETQVLQSRTPFDHSVLPPV